MGIHPGRCNPFRVVDPNPIRTQGSAGAQPWAKRLNPFGIRLAAIPRIPNSKRRPQKNVKSPAADVSPRKQGPAGQVRMGGREPANSRVEAWGPAPPGKV